VAVSTVPRSQSILLPALSVSSALQIMVVYSMEPGLLEAVQVGRTEIIGQWTEE
jgi:hypothetical protein